MRKDSLKEYLSTEYKGSKSFLENVLFPIFGREDFANGFEKELLDDGENYRSLANSTGIESVKYVGMMFVGVEPLQIFDVTVKDSVIMERNRVNVQKLVRSLMEHYSCAFMLFHYADNLRWDWRFTFCHKRGSNNDITESKRYTFLLGPGQSCRTATENFFKLYENRNELGIKSIEDAFNVEALSKEFFDKYKEHYERFVEYITGKRFVKQSGKWEEVVVSKPHPTMYKDFYRDDKLVRDYIKMMLGRIVFLHFLQKKGWLGVPDGCEWGKGDKDFMLHLFENATKRQKDNYLDDVLEPLFSKALDKDRSHQNDCFDTGVEGFRKVRIPYLNGGLFERDRLDEKQSRFPAKFFGDLLTMLSQYNFTIDENDPNDAEVGVDPEMLGRIFENLLEDNKDKGAFYTPKEIVQYMCKESLIAYLQTWTNEAYKDGIRQFVLTHEAEYLGDQISVVKQKLRDVKICDPAIGSGAFPMGLLRELFFCRTAISPDLLNDTSKLKREIIQNNIYGVDIEKGAVEIARLRFWLSLIVDEKKPVELPNLDYKIVQGNSLIPTFCGSFINLNDENKKQYKKSFLHIKNDVIVKKKRMLQELQNQFFYLTGKDKYLKLIEIKKTILDIIKTQLSSEQQSIINSVKKSGDLFNSEASLIDESNESILENQEYLNRCNDLIMRLEDKSVSLKERAMTDIFFFDWRIIFSDAFNRPSDCEIGFDIVIGNPPFVDSETMTRVMPHLRKLYSSIYSTAKGNWDMFVVFAEQGCRLISQMGIFSFIIPNKILAAKYAGDIREFLSQNNILEIRDYSRVNVFEEAAVYPCTIIMKKSIGVSQKDKTRFTTMSDITTMDHSVVTGALALLQFPYWDVFFNDKKTVNRILKIYSNVKIGELPNVEISGAATVAEAYILKESVFDDKNAEDSFKMVNTGTIDPYHSLWGECAMQYLKGRYMFPRITHTDVRRMSQIRFEQARAQKIIVAGMSNRIEAILDMGETLAGKSTSIIISSDLNTLKVMLAVLNSEIISWYMNLIFNSLKMAGGYLNFGVREISIVPLPILSDKEKTKLIKNVDKIISLRNPNEELHILSEIDKVVRTAFLENRL